MTTTKKTAASELTNVEKAEIKKSQAEQRFFEANARVASALAEQEEITLRVRKRAEQEVLSRDEYHCVYAFDHDVTDDSVKLCVQTLTGWARKEPGCEMEIQLNTDGGSIFAGFALIDFIRDLRNRGHAVTVMVYGQAASMGAVILQAASKRVIGENAFLLLHEGSLFAAGDWGHVEDEIQLMKKLHTRILTLLTERSEIDARTIKSKWRRTDWWLTAAESLDVGLVDEIR